MWGHSNMSIAIELRSVVRWVKKNPIYGLVAILAPVLGVVAAVPSAWSAIAEVAGLPKCVFYSDVYYYYGGHFRNNGELWVEYQPKARLTFQETYRTRDHIVLLNKTPRADPRWESMLVRLPACGGTAQWTYENPQQWIDLFEVTPTVSAALAKQQAAFER